MTTKRLFIGARIKQQDVARAVRYAQGRFRMELPGIELKPEPMTHITLRFLGDVDFPDDAPPPVIERIHKSIEYMAGLHDPIHPIILDHVGAFPPALWLGVKRGHPNSHELFRLQTLVDRIVLDSGFPPADFKYAPHITVGRFHKSASQHVFKTISEWGRWGDEREFKLAFGLIEILESVRLSDGGVSYQPVFRPSPLRNLDPEIMR